MITAFVAEAPQLYGCKADGDSYMTALKNIERVIDEWIEVASDIGRNIPVPSVN